jgi:hypothetical protein
MSNTWYPCIHVSRLHMYYLPSLCLIKGTFAYLFASSLNIMDSKWIFALVNGATYICADQIRKKPICNFCHKEGYVSMSHMVCLQQIEEIAK